MGVQKPQVSHDDNTARGRDGAVSWVHGYHKRHHRSNMAWEFIQMVGVPHDFSGNDQLQHNCCWFRNPVITPLDVNKPLVNNGDLHYQAQLVSHRISKPSTVGKHSVLGRLILR